MQQDNSQKFLTFLNKQFHDKKLSHAFLLETNNQDKALVDILNFIKVINCPHEYQDNCTSCNMCHLIDELSLPNLVIIKPDGTTIKKEQILDLKKTFQTMPVFAKYNVYIILNAELLNSSSANTMLKFLEEPEDNIIGFFVTNNKENIIDTIKSRCQLFSEYYENTSVNLNSEILEEVKKVINLKEKNYTDAFVYYKEELGDILTNKQDVIMFYKYLLSIYQYAYHKCVGFSKLNKVYEDMDFLIQKGAHYLLKEVQFILKLLDDLQYNINTTLVFDRFLLEKR